MKEMFDIRNTLSSLQQRQEELEKMVTLQEEEVGLWSKEMSLAKECGKRTLESFQRQKRLAEEVASHGHNIFVTASL